MQYRTSFLKLIAFSCATLLSAACKKSSTSNATHRVSIAGQNNGYLYVGGYQLPLNGQIQSGYWLDGKFTQLYADPRIVANISDLTVAGSDVYVTAWIDSAYYSIPFYWKNGQRITLPGGPGTYYPAGQTSGSISVVGSDVYVAGTVTYNYQNFTSAAYWKNGSPIFLTHGISNATATGIFATALDVFVAGSAVNSQSISAAAYWKDNNPIALSDSTTTSVARSICAY